MEQYLNKYYESGDSLIKVLHLLDSDEGSLFVCLNYSYNHKYFHIETFKESEFKEWYEVNEISGYDVMPEIKASNLL